MVKHADCGILWPICYETDGNKIIAPQINTPLEYMDKFLNRDYDLKTPLIGIGQRIKPNIDKWWD